ncbi:PrgI family protein [Amycolatopsis aidingensis]|uniref:PrgI family protein n=1 Tax=Amycolatopsis aidingensis TaxID=2842453 RepID=UPI001C0A98D2|nr:PrgI family protein [Amycolatopsis aidingensis]
MTQPVRIPADVDREDRVLVNLTARQLAILAVTGLVLHGAWTLTRSVVPLPVFLIVAIPIGVTAVVLALGQRDGISLDRLLLAAIRQRLQPRHRVAAPEGVRAAPEWLTHHATTTSDTPTAGESEVSPAALRLPAEGVTEAGVVDLGTDGVAMVAVASTVNFALRTPGEQEALVAAFGRYLHSISAPVQVLIRAERLDLTRQISDLREAAPGLPHPMLEAAAREHAQYLDQLRHSTDLLRRQVLLVLREPVRATGPTDGLGGPSPLAALRARRYRAQAGEVTEAARRSAETRLVRRLGEATELLSPAGITITPLDAGQATAVLATACNPDSLIPPSAGLAGADEVITTAADPDNDPPGQHRATARQHEPDTTPAATALEDWEGSDL